MTLHLVCDISGSMGEGGKPFIMRSAVMAIAQWVRLGYARAEVRLCGWGADTRHFPEWSVKDDFPAELLSIGGRLDADALVQWLGGGPKGKVLLLTDGYWSRDGARVLKHWKECLPPDTLRVIKIGADANPQLKGPDVFAVEDMFAALGDWLDGDSP